MSTYKYKIQKDPLYLELDNNYLNNNNVIPYKLEDDKVFFLGPHSNYNLISNLEFLLNKQVEIIKVPTDEYVQLNHLYFEKKNHFKKHELNIFNLDNENMDNIEIINYLNELIELSIIEKASDIHIEPFKDHIRIRRRIDGKLFTYNRLPLENLSIITTRLKILGGLEISEKRLPHDGRITFDYKNRDVDLRIATIPVIYGEKISIRILDSGLQYNNIDNLGLNKTTKNKLIKNINSGFGFILVCGPTSSGKSTTVSAMLNEINKDSINIITIEDPVEYKVQGINQIEINYRTGLKFENTLNAILRHDPEVISIGELRSKETITTGLRASMTGHLVFSTLHTKDSISSIFRLRDMGVENYILSNSLTLIVSQRLVRVLCSKCKEKYIDDSGYFDDKTLLYKPIGCSQCNDGFIGRRGVFEVLEIDENIKTLINNNNSYNSILKAAKKKGFTTLKEEFDNLLLSGITSIEEFTVING